MASLPTGAGAAARRAIHHAVLRTPQDQPADRIGEAAAGHREALGLELRGRLLVGREQHLERGAVADLRVEAAGGTQRDHRAVAGAAGKAVGDLLDGRAQVGRRGHLHLAGAGAQGSQQGDEEEEGARHGHGRAGS
jgi:hypothetical protein